MQSNGIEIRERWMITMGMGDAQADGVTINSGAYANDSNNLP